MKHKTADSHAMPDINKISLRITKTYFVDLYFMVGFGSKAALFMSDRSAVFLGALFDGSRRNKVCKFGLVLTYPVCFSQRLVKEPFMKKYLDDYKLWS